MKKILLSVFLTFIMLNICSSIPKGATPVKPFDKAKYLGKWYEIARMDFRDVSALIWVEHDSN